MRIANRSILAVSSLLMVTLLPLASADPVKLTSAPDGDCSDAGPGGIDALCEYDRETWCSSSGAICITSHEECALWFGGMCRVNAPEEPL